MAERPAPNPSLMAELRLATRENHARLDASEYFRVMREGKLAIESYVGMLRSMQTLHTTLERQIRSSDDPLVGKVWDDSMAKTPLIAQDLAYFAPRKILDVPEVIAATLRAADKLMLGACSAPASLLGYLYVLEGSTLGGPILRTWAMSGFGLVGYEGTRYLASYGSEREARWRQFSNRMDALPLDGHSRAQATDAAVTLFDGIADIFAKLHPIDPKLLRPLAVGINPEAGSHAVPDDLRVLEAAVRAGQSTWKRFPYYEQRYGERGRRFTASDSAWLCTLGTLEQREVDRQVQWLGNVLASRGMPRWLLQQHLETLHAELARTTPDRHLSNAKLAQAAAHLAESIAQAMPLPRLKEIARYFEAKAPRSSVETLPEAGLLLAAAAAVADELAGIPSATASLVEWLTDPRRFPADWIAAVEATLQAARGGVGNSDV